MERVASLAYAAKEALDQAGVTNATVLVGDGTLGWRSCAPFDAIVVAAASPGIPEPLKEQLAPGGRMVIPVGMGETQQLVLVEREGDNFREKVMADVRFVPLLGRHGF